MVAALLGTAVGAFFATRRRRLTVATAVSAFASLPILPGGVSLTSCVFAFWDVPALTGTATAIYCGLWRRRAVELKAGSVSETIFNGSRRETTFCAGALIAFGAALYASELNLFAFDVYRFGYASNVGLTVACVAAAFASRRVAAPVVGAYVATAAGLYANFFDAILDFGFWAFLTVAALLTAVRRGATKSRRRKGTSSVATATEPVETPASAVRVGRLKRRVEPR